MLVVKAMQKGQASFSAVSVALTGRHRGRRGPQETPVLPMPTAASSNPSNSPWDQPEFQGRPRIDPRQPGPELAPVSVFPKPSSSLARPTLLGSGMARAPQHTPSLSGEIKCGLGPVRLGWMEGQG